MKIRLAGQVLLQSNRQESATNEASRQCKPKTAFFVYTVEEMKCYSILSFHGMVQDGTLACSKTALRLLEPLNTSCPTTTSWFWLCIIFHRCWENHNSQIRRDFKCITRTHFTPFVTMIFGQRWCQQSYYHCYKTHTKSPGGGGGAKWCISHPAGVGSEKDGIAFFVDYGRSEGPPTMKLPGLGNASRANERIIIFGSNGICTCGEEIQMGVSILHQWRGEEWSAHFTPHFSQIPPEWFPILYL